MEFLFGLLFVFFFGPALALFALFALLGEIARYYGGWLIPAVFCLTIGIQLKIIGPSDTYAQFESLLQALAGSHIAGIPTPGFLIGVGVFCLLAKPVYNSVRLSAHDREK